MSKAARALKELLTTVLMAAVIAFAIRTFIIEPKLVPTESMVPTIIPGDRVIVEKIAYRFRLPERGEIVVFDPPERSALKEVLLKRVIAVAGDTVEVRNGTVYVNGAAQAEAYVKNRDASNLPRQTVPGNCIFVMGDNRPGSYDSRAWGFVERRLIIGRAIARFWPLSRVGAF